MEKNGVEVIRVTEILPEGTPDPDVLETAYQDGYALLTHDERITKHIADRVNAGKDYAGVFIAVHHLQGMKGVGKIVTELTQFDAEIKAGTKTIADNVYNQLIYIS
ncbi:MAG: hypothetical protein AAFR81_24970 [Chloroflexota bacterium]